MSMNDHRARRWAAISAAVVVCILPAGPGLASGAVSTADAVAETTPQQTTPDTTEPDTTEPDTSEPATSEPDTTDPNTTGSDDDADALTWIAIVGALLLLGIAVWWMVRSTPDEPRPPPMDSDWPNRSEVV